MSFQHTRSETVFLHLRKGRYSNELMVSRMVKSEDAAVEPGDVVVKLKVNVPPGFFDTARPFMEVEFSPENALQPTAETIDPDDEA